ncbi:testis-specific gene 13 protein isoform 2-T2 [Anomaloglossus baeobatrachus]
MTISQGTLKCSLFAKIPSSKFLHRIQDFKRTLEIMYRASKINQDKAVLIISNNSATDFTKWQKSETPMQYFCKELIQNQCGNKEINTFSEQAAKPEKKQYRLGFVTEDTCKKFKGEFSKHFRERKSQVLEGTIFPIIGYQLPSKNESAFGRITEHAATTHFWETLTYTALMDSMPSLTVSGRGDFRHGQPTMWINSTNAKKD